MFLTVYRTFRTKIYMNRRQATECLVFVLWSNSLIYAIIWAREFLSLQAPGLTDYQQLLEYAGLWHGSSKMLQPSTEFDG